MFFRTTICRLLSCLDICHTDCCCDFFSLLGINGGFTDTQTVLLHLQASGNNSVVKSLAPVISACENLSFPLSHTLFKSANKKTKKTKISQQKRTKADTCHVREGTFPYREYNMFVNTPSTEESLMKAPVSPKGWNGLSELTGSWQGGQGEAGLCGAHSWTPSPLCGLGPAAIHQTACPLASNDAFSRLKEPL